MELNKLLTHTMTEEQIKVLNRIRRNIKRSENEYALYFVECNLPNLRKQLIDELNSANDLNILTLNLAEYSKDNSLHIDEWVSKNKRKYQAGKPKRHLDSINIIGLEQLLPTGSNEQIIKTVSELNWRRSYFQELAVPIVFWLPSYALVLLANQASDFYDWYSDIYYIKSSLQQKKVNYSHQALTLYHPKSNIPAHQYQSGEEKEKQLRQLNALLDETNSKNDIAYIKNQMGLMLFTMGYLEKALILFQETYIIFKELGYTSETARISNNISQVLIKQGKLNLALKYLKSSLSTINKVSNETTLGAILNSMGEVYDALGEDVKALKYYEGALKACRKVDDKTGISATLNNIASIYYTRGDYKSSLEYFIKSLTISKEINSKLGAITALANIASIYELCRDYDSALFNFYQSLDISEEIGDKLANATTLHSIASLYQVKGDYVKALDYFRQSMIMFELLNDEKGLAYSSYNLGFMLKETDKKSQIEADKYLEQAYALAKKLNLKDILSENLIHNKNS